MKLELKNLAPYLPYGFLYGIYENQKVIIRGMNYNSDYLNIDFEINNHNKVSSTCFFNEIKPILRPLSDLKKEIDYIKYGKRVLINDHVNIMKLNDDKKEYKNLSDIYFYYGNVTDLSEILETFNSLFELHFDVFGLIEKGLAIDINTLPQSSE